MMTKMTRTCCAALLALSLLAAACGSDDPIDEAVATAATQSDDGGSTEPDTSEPEADSGDTDSGDTDTSEPNSSDSDSDQAVIQAVAAQLREEEDTGSIDVDCLATALVNGLGGAEAMAENYDLTVETIEAGAEPDNVELPKDQAITLADEAMGCGLADSMITEMTADGLSKDEATCLLGQFDEDVLRDMMATGFMSEADAQAVEAAAETDLFTSMFTAMDECSIDPSVFG